jgi:hypothetical protein
MRNKKGLVFLGCLALFSVLLLISTEILLASDPPREKLCKDLFPTAGCPNGGCDVIHYTTGPCIIYGCIEPPNMVMCF